MKTHFPPSATTNVDTSEDRRNVTDKAPKIDESMVKEAIKSFKPFKAAGPDMVFPALLQKEVDIISSNLAGIFNACLKSRVFLYPNLGRQATQYPSLIDR